MTVGATHEIALNYDSQLKIKLIFPYIFANHNLGLPRFLHFEIFQIFYLIKTLIMLISIFTYAMGHCVMTLYYHISQT